MSQNVAEFLNLNNKGQLKVGFDADIIIWDPEASFMVQKEIIRHKHNVTPYLWRATFWGHKSYYG